MRSAFGCASPAHARAPRRRRHARHQRPGRAPRHQAVHVGDLERAALLPGSAAGRPQRAFVEVPGPDIHPEHLVLDARAGLRRAPALRLQRLEGVDVVLATDGILLLSIRGYDGTEGSDADGMVDGLIGSIRVQDSMSSHGPAACASPASSRTSPKQGPSRPRITPASQARPRVASAGSRACPRRGPALRSPGEAATWARDIKVDLGRGHSPVPDTHPVYGGRNYNGPKVEKPGSGCFALRGE